MNILADVFAIEEEIIAWRRHIHAHPELGYAEFQTAEFVAGKLGEWGLEVHAGVGGTSVVGVLHGASAGRSVALRADMDALPVTEETGLSFASRNPGCMHACGHDGHTAMLLGAAKVLAAKQSEIAGTVKFLFQSAEECSPRGGAIPLIEAGALDNPKVDYIFALHLWPEVPFGKVGVKAGPLMSASDRIQVHVTGRGGHGAAPHQTVDAVVVASHIVTALQAIVSRQMDPLEPVVVTIGRFIAGQRHNVIAPTAYLDGTVRTQNEVVRQSLPHKISQLVEGIAAGFGASASVDYEFGYPTLHNHPEGARMVVEATDLALGEGNVVTLERPSMGGEDFAYYLDHAVGAMFWLGCKGPGASEFPVHNSRFDFDEQALSRGTAVMAEVALQALRK
ncbi:MAG: N-acyl-L-amino acid amidohydrolase [Firmicutes bacterium]|nr:N-acyl-L-amino acid amidohydrolase [Bacillota bacterium]